MNSLHNLVVSGKVLYLVSHGSHAIFAGLIPRSRAYRTLPRGSSRRRTCTLGWLERRRSLSTRARGTSCSVTSSETSSQWRARKVSIHMFCGGGDECTMRQGWHWSRGTCLRAGKSAQTKRKKGVAARERKASGS